MKWSFRIARVFGIDIRVHLIFLIVPVLIALQNAAQGVGMALLAAGFTLMVFLFVVLHELGHSLVAMRHGIGVRDITLLPIGGVARLEAIPEDPATELKIAIAGPLVNIGIALLLTPLFFIAVAGSWSGLHLLPAGPADVLLGLILINGIMAAFNLLPAFPLDGGRILRALLAWAMPYVRATHVAAMVGRLMAGLMFVAAVLLKSWLLGLVAMFVLMAGMAEERVVRARHAYRERMQRQVLWEGFRPTPGAPPSDAGQTQEEAARAFESLARTFRPGPSQRRPRD